jgi:hypothetical protein
MISLFNGLSNNYAISYATIKPSKREVTLRIPLGTLRKSIKWETLLLTFDFNQRVFDAI